MVEKGFDPGILESNLKKVFSQGQMFTLIVGDGEFQDIFMKVPCEETINNARVYALRKSKEYREQLLKSGDIEGLYPQDISNELEKEDIVGYIIKRNTDVYVNKARSIVAKNIRFPKPPDSYATLEDWERYQKEVDEWPSKFSEILEQEVKKLIEHDKKILLEKQKDELIALLKKEILNSEVAKYNIQRYLDYILHKIVFDSPDMKKRLFESPDVVKALPVTIRKQLVEYYYTISLDTGYLKK